MQLAEANRIYFDQISDSYDTKPFFQKVNQQVSDALRERLAWVGIPFATTDTDPATGNVRLLDYACGTGSLSRVYGPYITAARGIDLSPNMVASFNARARSAGLSESTMSAVVGDLLDKQNASPAELAGPEWKDFDLATAGFAFHHFEDAVYAAKCLKNRLRPGGALVITDFLDGGDLKADENGQPIPGSEGDHVRHHHHDHGHHHRDHTDHDHDKHDGHHHHPPYDHGHKPMQNNEGDPTLKVREEMKASIVVPNFTSERVKNIFADAGLVEIDVVPMEQRVYMEFAGQKLWRTILFARGKRPLDEKSEL